MKHSATLAINEQIRDLRSSGENVLHMGFGESPFPVHPLISQALCEHADVKRYLPTQGILPLRVQISKFYKVMFGLEYPPQQIIVGPGSKTLIHAALTSLEGPLLLPAPSWVSYQHQARLIGKEVYHIKTEPDNSYRLTPESLKQAIQQHDLNADQQKILIINYPCNPTGHSFSESELKDLAVTARENNIIVLSDEIYALISYKNHEHHSIAEFYPEGSLVTGGLSKDRSLGGYRVGVMLIPQNETELLNCILSLGSETWSCVSAPVQYAAIEAYRTDSPLIDFIHDCTMIHEIVTNYVHQRLLGSKIRCPSPKGAFYLFPDWNDYSDELAKHGIITSTELANHLLSNWSVAALPGSEFGMAQDDLYLRLTSVDYDGSTALDYFRKNRSSILDNTDNFVEMIAPQVVSACDQLEQFTKSLR